MRRHDGFEDLIRIGAPATGREAQGEERRKKEPEESFHRSIRNQKFVLVQFRVVTAYVLRFGNLLHEVVQIALKVGVETLRIERLERCIGFGLIQA